MARSPARKTPKAAAPSAAAATPDAEAAGTAPAAAEAAGADAEDPAGTEGATTDRAEAKTEVTEEAVATDPTGAGADDAADDVAARGSVLQSVASLEPAPVDPDAPQRYVVCSPLEHDLVLYGIGAELSLTEAQAAPLLGHTVALKNT